MKNIKKFDIENFNYDECYEQLKKEIKKPNILVCGGTGVGKSSLINDIFNVEVAEVGNNAEAQTRGVKQYTSDKSTINLFDTEGYEIGSISFDGKEDKYFENIIGTIDKRLREYPGNLEKHIHEVWYCINNRFYDIDAKVIQYVMDKKVPVAVIITKVDMLDEEELNQVIESVHNVINEIPVFTYSTNNFIHHDNPNYEKYVQKSELVDWALKNLDESLQSGFIPALKAGLKEKRNYVFTHTIPLYTGLAAGAVLSMAIVNVPFADSVPLMGLQVKMSMDIIKKFGIENDIKRTIGDILGANVISYIGKTLASQILSVIPVVGNVVKGTVNVSVAATITAILGVSISIICEQYLKACIDNEGSDGVLDFSDFITQERLKEVMDDVTNNKEKHKIPQIIKNGLSKIRKK